MTNLLTHLSNNIADNTKGVFAFHNPTTFVLENYAMRIVAVILSFFSLSFSFAQENWTLEQCIGYALKNNLQIRQGILSAEMAQYDVTQSKMDMLPNLNGFGSHGYNYGRTIDPFTNQFTNNRIQSNSFSLNSSVILFAGFQKMNTAKQSEINYQAAKYDADNVRNNASLSIATAYLQVLFNKELLKIANSQLAITEKQVDRTQKLVDVEKVAIGSLYDIQAQLAQEELNKVNATNSLSLSLLNLKQLLDLPLDTPFNVVVPNVDIPTEAAVNQTPGSVYQNAVTTLPEIKSTEYRLRSAEKGLAIAKSGMSPRLSLAASVGTGFSDQRQDITQTYFDGYVYDGSITSAGDSVLNPSFSFDLETIPFKDQLENNFNQTVGFNLNIPIFNGWSTRTAINKAKISVETAEIELQIRKNDVRKTVEQAHADATAALNKYRASEKTVKALEESFGYTQKRFDVGLINSTDYSDSKTRLTNARSELLQAKYDFIFKTKVLDFYQGKPLSF